MTRPLTAIAVAAVSLLLLAAMSRVPWRLTGDPSATLRVSARLRVEIEERCRPATAEELAAQAAHMRQPVICDKPRAAPYTLSVGVDDRILHSAPLPGSGKAGEGTLYIMEDFRIDAGARRVRVTLERDWEDPAGVNASRPTQSRESARHAIPPRLALDTTLSVEIRSIVLVTYEPEREALVIRSRSIQ
jgi:hypothetical protein